MLLFRLTTDSLGISDFTTWRLLSLGPARRLDAALRSGWLAPSSVFSPSMPHSHRVKTAATGVSTQRNGGRKVILAGTAERFRGRADFVGHGSGRETETAWFLVNPPFEQYIKRGLSGMSKTRANRKSNKRLLIMLVTQSEGLIYWLSRAGTHGSSARRRRE